MRVLQGNEAYILFFEKKKTFTDKNNLKSQVYLAEVKVQNRCHVFNQEFSTCSR